MQLDEIHYALAVEPGDHGLDPEGVEQDATFFISITAGLITVDVKSGTIRSVDFTVEEYFLRKWKDWFPNAEEQIAGTCITYLLFDNFADGYSINDEEMDLQLQRYPFLCGSPLECPRQKLFIGEHLKLSLELIYEKSKVACTMQIRDLPDWKFEDYSQRLNRCS